MFLLNDKGRIRMNPMTIIMMITVRVRLVECRFYRERTGVRVIAGEIGE